nr:RecName: Full=Endoglucanase 1; AltName: Full=Endo-1,4-beta-D-glucanase 1 [Trichoderma viride]
SYPNKQPYGPSGFWM